MTFYTAVSPTVSTQRLTSPPMAGPSAMHVKEAHVTTETAKPLSVLPDHRDHKDGLLIPIHPIYEQIKHSVITEALSVAHVPE